MLMRVVVLETVVQSAVVLSLGMRGDVVLSSLEHRRSVIVAFLCVVFEGFKQQRPSKLIAMEPLCNP